MSAAAQQLLDSFEALADTDRRQVAVEILRRFAGTDVGDLSEEALVEAADELFRSLDAEEARHASR